MFRYSGSKKRLIKYLPMPPTGVSHIVEPFAGSLAYTLHYRPARATFAEANAIVRELLVWLATSANYEDLVNLDNKRASSKLDVRGLNLPRAQETLLRLQTSGAYVGQLSSWTLYPQHSPRCAEIWSDAAYLQTATEECYEDYAQTAVADGKNTMFFIDPVYENTAGNYNVNNTGNKTSLDYRMVEDFILSLRCPTCVTYGDGAHDTFPRLTWTKLCDRRVPILRGGGTKLRQEWIAVRNWR